MTDGSLIDSLHCFVDGRRERAASGDGVLAGRTVAVKDLFDVAGEPTGAGCQSPLTPSPSRTAPAVQRILDAGALYVGKTHMVELAFGGWGVNRAVGTPRNPWDADQFRVAGGSSSGSAVAVAAGLSDIALGSDTGGSIRIPAALCGVVGLKASHGRIAMGGVAPLAPSLDSIGPLASSVADAALVFAVMVGEAPVTEPGSLEGMRLRSPDDVDVDVEPDVKAAYRAALQALARAGARIQGQPLDTPPGAYAEPCGQISGFEAWALYGQRVTAHAAVTDPGVRARFETVSLITQTQYRDTLSARTWAQARFAAWFDGADFLVTPTTPRTAARAQDVDEGDFTLARYTRMANYLDLCGLSVPCGFDRHGLPIGLQILARAHDEARLLAAGWAMERALALPPRRPPLHRSRSARTLPYPAL